MQSLSAVGLGCMAVRKRLWVKAGGLDTTMLRARYRDVDFCLRLADNGYRNRWHPGAEPTRPIRCGRSSILCR